MTQALPVLDMLRIFSFLSQESVPVTGAFVVDPIDSAHPPRDAAGRRAFHSA